jgi:hypothetical protein
VGLLLVWAGQALAANDSFPGILAQAASTRNAWLRGAVIFLLIAVGGGYVWYFGVFPRLLQKKNPNWPLDAWRLASYGAWLTICAGGWFFKQPLMVSVFKPLLTGVFPNVLIEFFMEFILIPLFAIVGLLVIWNFRRDAANRARPG